MNCDMYPCINQAKKHYTIEVSKDEYVDVDLCYYHANPPTKSTRNNPLARGLKNK